MKNSSVKVLIFVGAVLTALAFQNCTKTKFEEADLGLVQKTDAALNQPNSTFQPNDSEDNQEDMDDVADDNDLPADSGVGMIPGQADNSFPEYDPGDNESSGGYNSGGEGNPVVGAAPGASAPGSASPIIPAGAPPLLSDIPHNDSSDDPKSPPVWSSDSEAAANCASFRAHNLSLPFDFTYSTALALVFRRVGSVSVTNAELLFALADRGPMFVSSPLTGKFFANRRRIVASTMWRLRGPLCVSSATSGGGSLRRLINHRGYAEINNMNVFKIRRLRGVLVIRDSKVEKIIHHRGPIILINSKVGKIRNQIGPIYLVGNSSVGKYKNVRRRL